METLIEERPWDTLRDLALAGDRRALEILLEDLPASEAVRALLRLNPEDQQRLLITLDPSDAAELIDEVPDHHAAEMVERLPAAEAASILQELQSDDQADLIGDIDTEEAEAILAEMAPEAAADVRRLAEYDPETAGGVMMTEVFAFDDTATVRDVLNQLTSDAADLERYHGQHPYVVSKSRELLGVVSLRNLLLLRRDTPLAAVASGCGTDDRFDVLTTRSAILS